MKMRPLISLLTIFSVTSVMTVHTPVEASDHIDGPITSSDPIADLADFYFFPSPEDSRRTVLIVNTHFAAYSENHFNEGILYQFQIREANIDSDKKRIRTENTQTISCWFKTPRDHSAHTVNCETSRGHKISGETEAILENSDLRVFSGLRSDPFFFDLFWVNKLVQKGFVPIPSGNDIMLNLNALSIVVEVDLKKLFPENSKGLYAANVAAIALGEDDKTLGEQFDWVGRPEITNVTMAARNAEDLRDEYNQLLPWSLAQLDWSKFHQKIFENIQAYDDLNDPSWSDKDLKNFTRVLIEDALVLDLSKPCLTEGNYLNIEVALIAGKDHKSCGGRQLKDDFLDTIATYYVEGQLNGKQIRDGVDAPHKDPSVRFPYLREPEISWTGWAAMRKARFLKWISGGV